MAMCGGDEAALKHASNESAGRMADMAVKGEYHLDKRSSVALSENFQEQNQLL